MNEQRACAREEEPTAMGFTVEMEAVDLSGADLSASHLHKLAMRDGASMP